jgi:acetyl-CoA acetyltransferase
VVWGGGGGGACAAIGNAAAAIVAGHCNVAAVYHGIRQPPGQRFGEVFARSPTPGGTATAAGRDFIAPYGLMAPGQMFALIVRRHMHLYGTTSEHLAHVAMTQREHARRNPKAIRQDPMTMEDYFNARMISDPFRLFDYCNENDGAGALILVSAERARDLKQKPAYVMAVAQGGAGGWGNSIGHQTMPEAIYATAGHGQIASDLYAMAGVGPNDIDVAELYDHFSGMVLLQLEDYGFCDQGESGALAAAGGLRWDTGKIPVNTHGGNLSEVYLHGTTHMIEGVRQIRGTSTAQVEDAELALVTGGPSPIPSSSMILHG